MSKIRFIATGKNPYVLKQSSAEIKPGEFVPRSKTGSAQMIRDNTMNITGRKVTFKHV